jgi:glycosyltransferase involved in cell wall biosynthesis
MKTVLFWGDNPHGITGFGKVIKNVIRQVYDEEKYKIDVLGISYLGDPYIPDEYEGKKLFYDTWTPFQAGRQVDLYATGKLKTMLMSEKVDILFILQDTFIARAVMKDIVEIRSKLKKKFVIVYYYPIDSHYVYPDWITNSVSLADFPVAYTNFGKRVSVGVDVKLKDMPVIYHGTDKNMFKPWDKATRDSMRESFWGKDVAKKFIVLNVNRNQPRKDLNRTFSAFAMMKQTIPDSYLFCLSNPADIGGNIIDLAIQYGLEYGKDWMCPDPNKYDPMLGVPEQQVVTMYNLSDVCMSTAFGEGWGLSLTEAMSCGCPVVFPDNTSMTEIIGNDNPLGDRGYLITSGKDGNTICLGPSDNNLARPLVDAKSMADTLVQIAKNRRYDTSEHFQKAKKAVEWVPSWNDVGEQWREVFGKAAARQDQLNGVT